MAREFRVIEADIMAKARQRRTAGRAKTAIATPPATTALVASPRNRPQKRPTGGTASGWPKSMVPVAIAALVVIAGIVTWQLTSSTDGGADGIQPIATLDTADVHSLLVDPQDPERVVFGSHAGTQVSRDGGFNWEDGELRNADAMQLAVSPKSPETLYATGHDLFQVSRDAGQSWQTLSHNLPGTDIHGFAQDPTDPLRLYAYLAGAGVFVSTDGGTNWAPLSGQPPGGGMHLVLATNGADLYAATGAGIVKSSDEGVTWTALSAQPRDQVISLAIPASEPQTLYAGTPNGLEKSTDGGASWTALGPQDVPALALAVTATEPSRVIFVSDTGAVYRSDDGGATWRS